MKSLDYDNLPIEEKLERAICAWDLEVKNHSKLKSEFEAMKEQYYSTQSTEYEAFKDLARTQEHLLKATQTLNYIMWRSRDDWQGFPTHIVLSALRELPKLPEPDIADE